MGCLALRIVSEIAKLKAVILHKPVLALRHLTPSNCHELLFDDALWVEKADEEHDYFETLLRHNGVEVYLLHKLLHETLNIPAAKNWLLTKRLAQLHHQSALMDDLAYFLNEQDTASVASYLLGGLTLKESGFKKSSLSTYTMKKHDFLIPPLPNHLFTRDSSAWIGNGVVISSMAFDARRGESLDMAAIYKFHPMFQNQAVPIWFNGGEGFTLPSLEGGDILVANESTLIIGLSQRTRAEAIEMLARTLFLRGEKKQILVIELPKVRASMHLDTMMSMISYDTFATAFIDSHSFRSWKISPGDAPDKLVIEEISDFYVELAKALNVDKIRLVASAGGYFLSQREQWSDSANLLAIAPGEVIAYDRNYAMNRKLRKAGVTVHEIPSSELSRGRGGARCMSCPILRS